MVYILTFVEGILAFLSPCVLPLIPVFASYFAAGETASHRGKKNALGFFLGLALVLISMGIFAGFLWDWIGSRPVEIIGGVLIVLFGLHYIGVLQIPSLHGARSRKIMDPERLRSLTFPWSVVFGVVFALCWAPCIGPLLGAALIKAGMANTMLEGAFLLFLFALGMGLPFLLSAFLIDRLKSTTAFLKRHHVAVNRISGGFLILIGILMISGLFGQLIH